MTLNIPNGEPPPSMEPNLSADAEPLLGNANSLHHRPRANNPDMGINTPPSPHRFCFYPFLSIFIHLEKNG